MTCDQILDQLGCNKSLGMIMYKVVHCKKEKYDVYIGRPSKWGNPFTIGIHGTREQVIQMYRDWETDRKSTRLNSSHSAKSRMPSSA